MFNSDFLVDEEIIPNFRKHSSKMFMNGRPIRFCYKLWRLCSAGGYLFIFEIYTLKFADKYVEVVFVEDMVIRLLKDVTNLFEDFLSFDNFLYIFEFIDRD